MLAAVSPISAVIPEAIISISNPLFAASSSKFLKYDHNSASTFGYSFSKMERSSFWQDVNNKADITNSPKVKIRLFIVFVFSVVFVLRIKVTVFEFEKCLCLVKSQLLEGKIQFGSIFSMSQF